jgi:hypothetical protein
MEKVDSRGFRVFTAVRVNLFRARKQKCLEKHRQAAKKAAVCGANFVISKKPPVFSSAAMWSARTFFSSGSDSLARGPQGRRFHQEQPAFLESSGSKTRARVLSRFNKKPSALSAAPRENHSPMGRLYLPVRIAGFVKLANLVVAQGLGHEQEFVHAAA